MPTPTEQLRSRTIYTTDGITTFWDFSFTGGYLDSAHVKAYIEALDGSRIDVAGINLVGPYQIKITPALASGNTLVIYRDTPKDLPIVDFTDGSGFSELSLDTNAKQAVFIAAETLDTLDSTPDAAAAASAVAAANSALAAAGSAQAAELSAASINTANLVNTSTNQIVNGTKTFSSPIQGSVTGAAGTAGTPFAQTLLATTTAAQARSTMGISAASGSADVGYTPAGTGAVPSTVQAKLRESYDAINDFGCDNTGATNTTTKLLAFYNACILTGAKGVIRAGTYKVTTGVLVFDNGWADKVWPDIETDGHRATIFQIDSATETNAAVLTWSNGTATSGVGRYWRGGSHGGLTILGSGTVTPYTSQHHYSLTGTWGIRFGWMCSTDCKGNSFHCPTALYGGSNPDPYANSFTHFDGIESNRPAGWGFYNANYVGMDSWYVENIRIIEAVLGGWFGIGSGNILNNWSLSSCFGWAFDDGCNLNATGGAPQRNYILIAEMDNCQYGIRLNRSSRTKFVGIRMPTRYQFSPNTSAVYWPITAVSVAGGTSPSVTNCELDVQFRIEAGGLVGNLGTTFNFNNNGNAINNTVDFDYLDNAGFGLTDTQMMGTGYRSDTASWVKRRSRNMWDSRDKAFSFGRGSAAATLVPNTGFGTSAAKISFPVQSATFYSVSQIYNTATSTFTAPHPGWYQVQVAIPLVMAVGTRVRMALFDGTTVMQQTYAYQINAGSQTYNLNTTVLLTAGQSVYVIADQNTGTATVAANIIAQNEEAHFIIHEV